MKSVQISCYILTFNSERTIGKVLQSAVGIFDEILIIDSGSTDSTVDAVAKFSLPVIYRRFDNFRDQRIFAENLCANDWVFALDSDEVISDELRIRLMEIKGRIGAMPESVAAVSVRRDWYALGRKVRNLYPVSTPEYIVRLFNRKKVGHKFSAVIHEKVEMGRFSVIEIDAPLMHYTCERIGDLYDKIELYTDLLATHLYDQGVRSNWIKLRLYPWLIWFDWYLMRGSWRDGRVGRVLSSYARDTVYLKYLKLQKIQRS